MLKTLIYTYSPAYTRELGIELIPRGIEPLEPDSMGQAQLYLEKDSGIQVLLTESYDHDFLEKTRAGHPSLPVFLIVHDSLKPSELVKLTKSGITGILNYNNNPVILAEEFIKGTISNNIRSVDKRLHTRVQPKSFEKVSASLFFRGQKMFVRGMVIDISAGGVAIRFPDQPALEYITPGNTYEPLFITIQGSDVKAVATLVGKRGDIAGFKFDNVEQKDMRKLAEYVHARIQDKTRDFIQSIVTR